MNEIVSLIKQAASQQVDAGNPVAVLIGEVISTEPLKIKLAPKLILSEAFFIFTKSVLDYAVNMSVNHSTDNHTHSHGYTDDSLSRTTGGNTHSHTYTGSKKFIVHNGLKVGQSVILLRVQGGKKFVVLDVLGGGQL